jgi:hypothetical protein
MHDLLGAIVLFKELRLATVLHPTSHLMHPIVEVLGLPMAELAPRVPNGPEVAKPSDAICVLQNLWIICSSLLRTTSLLCALLDVYWDLWSTIAG